jgi:hypothetical protein
VVADTGAGQRQQPGTSALGRRATGDQLVWQVKIKVIDIHHALPAWTEAGDDSRSGDWIMTSGIRRNPWYTAAPLARVAKW